MRGAPLGLHGYGAGLNAFNNTASFLHLQQEPDLWTF